MHSSRARCGLRRRQVHEDALALLRLQTGSRERIPNRARLQVVTRRSVATATFFAAVCASLTGCGDQAGPDLAKPATAATTSTQTDVATTLPKSYSFTLTSSCGERGLLGDYRVTVHDEQVSDVIKLNDDYPYEPKLTEIPTLQDMVDLAESARPDSVIEYVVDDTGVPRSLSLDPVPNGIDDEECYEVTDLMPVVSAASKSSVPISTSSWRPGDPSRMALISGSLDFTSEGCPHIGTVMGVVWPAGFTSFVKPSGEQVILTADGREIAEGDTIEAGGAAAGTKAEPGMSCIEPGTTLTLIQSSVEIIPGR